MDKIIVVSAPSAIAARDAAEEHDNAVAGLKRFASITTSDEVRFG
jgi:hypothetical protein